MVIRKNIKKAKKFYSKQGNRVVKRKARKEHQCENCYENIHSGKEYREISGDDGYGYYWTKRICSKCWE